jgi:hypothetical protein
LEKWTAAAEFLSIAMMDPGGWIKCMVAIVALNDTELMICFLALVLVYRSAAMDSW